MAPRKFGAREIAFFENSVLDHGIAEADTLGEGVEYPDAGYRRPR